jgi:hypothetical protein
MNDHLRVRQNRNGIAVETLNSTFAFHAVTGDRIRGGDKSDIDRAVTYVGDSLSKHYVRTHDMSEVPDRVLDRVQNAGYTILDGVEGGWANWDGRPEFSETFVDISEATAVSE